MEVFKLTSFCKMIFKYYDFLTFKILIKHKNSFCKLKNSRKRSIRFLSDVYNTTKVHNTITNVIIIL